MFETEKIKKIKKGTILLQPGQICKAGYKVIKGCLKSYVVDDKGKEHILQFAPEEWLISDLDSVVNNKPSRIFIETIEDSELDMLSVDMLLNNERLSNEELIMIVSKFRNNIISNSNRLISLLSTSSEDRYSEFIDTYPQLIQRLPQKLIASYLGMTPEHLSYIRKKFTDK